MSDATPLTFVVLLGSLRKASFNAAVARALPELAPEGVTIQPLGSIGDFPIYDMDLQADGIPPQVTEMSEAIRAADGVIIVTPEYNYSIPGGLKNALDWLSRVSPQPFVGKPVALQTASPGMLGGSRCQYHLRQVLVMLDARTLNKPEIFIGQVSSKVDSDTMALTDPQTREFIGKQIEALAAAVRVQTR